MRLLVISYCLVCFLAASESNAQAESVGTIQSHTDAVRSEAERAALDVVSHRTEAYNAHNIEAFLATYHQDVRVYEYPDRFLGEGRARMRDIFGPQFSDGEGLIKVQSVEVLEGTVISNEVVTIYGHTERNIGIYTIENGLIVEVRLIEPNEREQESGDPNEQ